MLDFSEVQVLTPSFADEFINGLKELYQNKKITFNPVLVSNYDDKSKTDIHIGGGDLRWCHNYQSMKSYIFLGQFQET